MSSSDRNDGNESGRKTPAGKGAPSEAAKPKPEPLERSPRGRIVIRSSSHPPAGERGGDARDVSGARALPSSDRAPAGVENREESAEARSKRSTPAERPRRRRKVQAERELQGVTSSRTSSAERPQQFAGSRRSTPDRLVARRMRVRARKIAIGVAIAILLGVLLWALRR